LKLKKVSVLENHPDSSLAKMGIAVVRHSPQDEGLHRDFSFWQWVGRQLNVMLCNCDKRKAAALVRMAARHYKGKPRPYSEAKSLNVIDPLIAPLVGQMNLEALIRTTGSCQGHGFWFVAVPPYVSFTTTVEVASALAKMLNDDFYGATRRLNYFWELGAKFDSNAELTYSLSVPGIASRKMFYATRQGLNQDFQLLGRMVQEILYHFGGQDIEMEGKPD
jgi:hypothetical protein